LDRPTLEKKVSEELRQFLSEKMKENAH